MAATKHTPTQVEEVLEKVAWMDRRGWNQYQIAKECKVTQPQVSYYLKKIRARYKERQLEHKDAAIQQQLEALREIRREAWLAWEKSKADSKSKTVQTSTAPKSKLPKGEASDKPDAGSTIESQARILEIVTTEGRLPSNPYLQTIMDTLKAERDLLGLDEAKKVDVRSVTIDWHKLQERKDASAAIVDGDEIEGKIEQVSRGSMPSLPLTGGTVEEILPPKSEVQHAERNGTTEDQPA